MGGRFPYRPSGLINQPLKLLSTPLRLRVRWPGEGVNTRRPLCTAGGGGKRCGHCGQQVGSSSKLHTDSPCDPAMLLLGIYPKELKATSPTTTYLLISPSFIITKRWKQPSVHRGMNGDTRHGLSKQWTMSLENEGRSDICSNMDGSGGHYAEISPSQKDKYCVILLIRGPQRSQTHRARKQNGGWGLGAGGVNLRGTELQFGMTQNLWRWTVVMVAEQHEGI